MWYVVYLDSFSSDTNRLMEYNLKKKFKTSMKEADTTSKLS